jgi:FkbM family methyltransferase
MVAGAAGDLGRGSDSKGAAVPRVVRFRGFQATFELRDQADHIQSFWERGLFYEEDLVAFLFHAALPGMRLLDVGAHAGNHTVFFAKVCGLPVTAIEPVPQLADHLSANLQLNGCEEQVTVHRCGAWDRSGRGSIAGAVAGNSGTSRLYVDGCGSVPLRTLDELVPEPVSIMKVDVEGAEAAVIAGAGRIIRSCRPIMIVEAADRASFWKIDAVLRRQAYRPVMRLCWTPTYVFLPSRGWAALLDRLIPALRFGSQREKDASGCP